MSVEIIRLPKYIPQGENKVESQEKTEKNNAPPIDFPPDVVVPNPIIDNAAKPFEQEEEKCEALYRTIQLQFPYFPIKDLYPKSQIRGKTLEEVRAEISQIFATRQADLFVLSGFKKVNFVAESFICKFGIDISGYSELVLTPEMIELLTSFRAQHANFFLNLSIEQKILGGCAMAAFTAWQINQSDPIKQAAKKAEQKKNIADSFKNTFMPKNAAVAVGSAIGNTVNNATAAALGVPLATKDSSKDEKKEELPTFSEIPTPKIGNTVQ